jgi:hypothetical protein
MSEREQIVAEVAALLDAHHQRLRELLEEHRSGPPRLLTAGELARVLGVSVDAIYRDAARLGAIRLGRPGSRRPALRFDVQTALERCREAPPSPPRPPRRLRSSRPAVPLLPVKGEESSNNA